MGLDIELFFKKGVRRHEFGSFLYHVIKGKEYTGIWLFGNQCSCGGELDARDYANVLEHEYVELLCARIAYQDGYREWNADGFNDVARRSKELE